MAGIASKHHKAPAQKTYARRTKQGMTRSKQRQDHGVTDAAFQDVLECLAREAAPSLDGRTYGHRGMATSTSPTANTAVLELTNHHLSGCHPDLS
jgi:hypothetical protein